MPAPFQIYRVRTRVELERAGWVWEPGSERWNHSNAADDFGHSMHQYEGQLIDWQQPIAESGGARRFTSLGSYWWTPEMFVDVAAEAEVRAAPQSTHSITWNTDPMVPPNRVYYYTYINTTGVVTNFEAE